MLICACPPLVLPYVPPILRALVSKLRAGTPQSPHMLNASQHGPLPPAASWGSQHPTGGYTLPPPGALPGNLMVSRQQGSINLGPGMAEGGVIASVLATTGALARVAGPLLRPHVNEILPLIIDALQDPGEGPKRHVAVLTLGQVRCMSLTTNGLCRLRRRILRL